ncbi:O-antigen ligase family protein [Streptomyces sp. NPDC002845]
MLRGHTGPVADQGRRMRPSLYRGGIMRMRPLSREAVLIATGAVAVCALLIVVLEAVTDGSGSVLAESTPGGAMATSPHSVGPVWLFSAALMALCGLATLTLPPALLLAGAIVLGHGLGVPALQQPLVGPLLISDVLLLSHLLRCLVQRRTEQKAAHRHVKVWLGLFLAWSFLATVGAGTAITPLLRITVYCAVFALLSNRETDRGQIYRVVLGYALVNIVGGVLQGQTRLVGLDIGDPAQMGVLLLAALCPLLTSEMRFTGRWAVGAVLLFGIFLTQTRSVWFATVVVLAVWAQKKVSLVRLTAVFLAFGLLGLKAVDLVTRWFGLNPASGDLRVVSVVNGIRAGLEDPVFGAGWGYVSSVEHLRISASGAADQIQPYNLLVNVFASAGLPAVLMLMLFLGELLRRLTLHRAAPLLFTVGVLAMSLVEMTLYAGSMLTVLFFTYAGMGLGPARSAGHGAVVTGAREMPRQATAVAGTSRHEKPPADVGAVREMTAHR